jgi:type II secretory pathway component GspD/PulD (secretin)
VKLILATLALLLALPALAATEKKIGRKSEVRAQPLAVTLDVKDEDVRDILKSMQKQCGIKNLAIDPQVQGKGTFYLRNIPCSTAFDIVLRTFGLRSVTYSSSLTAVERRP